MAKNNAPTTPLRPALARYKDKPRPTLSENPAGTPPPVPVIEGILDSPPAGQGVGEEPTQAVGEDRKPTKGEKSEKPAPASPQPPLPPQEVPDQVPFNSQIRFQTYLRIKQAQFYERIKIKDLTDEALNFYLNQFEGANTALPPKVLQEVLNQGKIKGYKKRGGNKS